MATRTHVMLDGLQDPLLGRDLSARWAAAGLRNAVDVGGQSAWLARMDEDDDATRGGGAQEETRDTRGQREARSEEAQREANGESDERAKPQATGDDALTEDDLAHAAAIARAYGVELRDRAGNAFVAANDLESMRRRMANEYRSRLAQALVFGLPAIVLHYIGPVLTGGSGRAAGGFAYPWLIEMALVGWSLWVGGLPILWQGAAAVLHLRATADAFASFVIVLAFGPSVFGVLSLLWTDQPWFGVPGDSVNANAATNAAVNATTDGATLNSAATSITVGGPAFHVAMMMLFVVLLQRWLMYAHIDRLAGRSNLMPRRLGRLFALWCAAMAVVWPTLGWHAALALSLVLPPMLGVGAINRQNPAWAMALPPLAFAPLLLFGPLRLEPLAAAAALRVEIAFGFALMMTAVFVMGWRMLPRGKARASGAVTEDESNGS